MENWEALEIFETSGLLNLENRKRFVNTCENDTEMNSKSHDQKKIGYKMIEINFMNSIQNTTKAGHKMQAQQGKIQITQHWRRLVFAMFAILVLLLGTNSFAKATTTSDLRILEEKFQKLNAQDEAAVGELVLAASQAVSSMPKAQDKKLDTIQVRDLVSLLRVSGKHDLYNRIIDDNTELFKLNEKMLREELRRIPQQEAKLILTAILVVFSSESASDYYEGMESGKTDKTEDSTGKEAVSPKQKKEKVKKLK